MHVRLDFFHGSKHYEPLPDCSKSSDDDQGPYYMQNRLPNNMSIREQMTEEEQLTSLLIENAAGMQHFFQTYHYDNLYRTVNEQIALKQFNSTIEYHSSLT